MSKDVKYHFFWSGPFSNWQPSVFKINTVEYTCAEQAMMAFKAFLFKDYDTAKKIMATHSPAEQKELGKKVKNFDIPIWTEKSYDAVKEILHAKFSQNEDLKRYLLTYKDYEIVEASPSDRIWGIGYWEKNALENIDNWGENRLGKILTELAQEL